MNDIKTKIDSLINEKKIKVREFKIYQFSDRKQMKDLFVYTFKQTDKTMTDFKFLPEYNQVIDWLCNTEGKGLFMAGNLGRGKSTILMSVLPAIFKAVWNRSLKPVSSRDISEPFGPFHCIDEIGTESVKNIYGNKNDMFELAVSDAEDNAKLLIASTNLRGSQISERYGARVKDRIDRLCKLVVFKGDSLRK